MLTYNELLSGYYIFSCLYDQIVSMFLSESLLFFFLLANISSILDLLCYIFFSWHRNVGLAPGKSISFVGASKGALMKGGYAGANQSRMAMSKNMMILPEAKQVEKMTISSAKTITQVLFFRILNLFENDAGKNLIEM